MARYPYDVQIHVYMVDKKNVYTIHCQAKEFKNNLFNV